MELLGGSTQRYLSRHLECLRSQWSGVLDADIESVHQARVATRRIRAALPLLPHATRADRRFFRDTGRRLGKVRELDVLDAQLDELEDKVPSTTAGLAAVRRDIRERQERARRRMVKALMRVNLRAVDQRLVHPGFTAHVTSYWYDPADAMRREVIVASDRAAASIGHAGGVYMPNRLHSVRIELKKLRYDVEIADGMRVVNGGELLPELKKSQDRLGRLHDLQVLLSALEARHAREDEGSVARELSVLEAVVAAECRALHLKYKENREQLLALCHDIHDAGRPRRAARAAKVTVKSIPALALAAAPVVLWRGSLNDSRQRSAR